MAHLIQPLEIEGTLYCVMYHGNRATRGVATSIECAPTDAPDVSNPASPWFVEMNGVATVSEISFGIGCGSEVMMSFETDGTAVGDYAIIIEAYINGVPDSSVVITDPFTSGGMTLDLTDYPCGNLITLVMSLAGDENIPPLTLNMVITSVS